MSYYVDVCYGANEIARLPPQCRFNCLVGRRRIAFAANIFVKTMARTALEGSNRDTLPAERQHITFSCMRACLEEKI